MLDCVPLYLQGFNLWGDLVMTQSGLMPLTEELIAYISQGNGMSHMGPHGDAAVFVGRQ